MNWKALILGLVLATISLPAIAEDTSAAALVARADRMRIPDDTNIWLNLSLTTISGTEKTQYHYADLVRRNAGSIVEALDGDQKGQKYLATPQGYWFYAPRTHRALRLTPLQVVRGQATIGDLSRLHFADDYAADFAPTRFATIQGRNCVALMLKARSDASTYSAIDLFLDKASSAPVFADYFSLSGRKLKSAIFDTPSDLGQFKVINKVTYIDGIDPSQRTVVETTDFRAASTPATAFRPEALQAP